MAFLLREGAEPITGYQLIKKLGTGGYGEVWKTTAPGGLFKAIKVIYGHMKDTRAEQELRALSRIKEVRHPFLLSLERFEIIEEQLFIVTELADGSLMDRYEECRKAGLVGIPREELLGYMCDTADVLDFMSERYGLQHLDIKPQNLLVVGRRIKLADFGLVKDLAGASASITGGVTPIYAPPEVFDGKVSRFSDQYSLAIVYQEMLTGLRPFPGKTALQLAVQHMNSPPLLDPLTPPDRPIIGRALAKTPEQRFATCKELVDQLLHSVAVPARSQTPSFPSSEELHSEDFSLGPAVTSEDEEGQQLLARDTIAEFALASPSAGTPPKEKPALLSGAIPPVAGDVKLRPTLFLGVGGMAGWTLRRLRQRLYYRFGSLAMAPIFRLLLVDTDRAGLRAAQAGDPRQSLRSDETLLTPLHKPEHYRSDSKEILRWLDRRWLYGIPRSQQTEGMRPLARLAMVDNAVEIMHQLRECLSQITSPEARGLTQKSTGLGIMGDAPRVFLIASIAGATGGGMLMDTAFAVQQVLRELSFSTAGVCGVLLHATSYDPSKREIARVNTLATLTEFHHFSRAGHSYPGDPSRRLQASAGTPLPESYLLHLGDQLSEAEAEAATDPVAEYLYLNSATAAGEFLDSFRRAKDPWPGSRESVNVRTFGIHQIRFPRQPLVEAAAQRLCGQLVQAWLGSPGNQDREVEAAARLQASSVGLETDSLSKRLRAIVHEEWEKTAEEHIGACGPDAILNQPSSKSVAITTKLVGQVLDRIDSLFEASPDPERSAAAAKPLRVVLHRKADELANALGEDLVRWLAGVLEDPHRRVRSTESAAKMLFGQVSGLADTCRSNLTTCERSRRALYQQLTSAEHLAKGGARRWLGLGRRRPSKAALRRQFIQYGLLRLQEVELDQMERLFRAIGRRLQEFNATLALGREKLEHFRDQFQSVAPVPPNLGSGPPTTTEVFPSKSRGVREGADQIFQELQGDFSAEFDRHFQAEYLDGQRGLWGLITRQRDWVEQVREELLRRAREAIGKKIQNLDAAQLFLDTHGEPAQVEQALKQHIQAAFPRLMQGLKGRRPHLWVTVPESPAGTQVREIVGKILPDWPRTILRGESEVSFCAEGAGLPLPKLASALLDQEGSYTDVARNVLTRIDVDWGHLNLEK